MNKKNKIIGIFFVLILALETVSAMGFALAPSTIEIESGFKGTEYFKTLIIMNSESPQNFSLNSSGEISDWITYYEKQDLENPISFIELDANEKIQLAVKVSIPNEAANGNYTSNLIVETVPENAGGGSTMKLKMSSLINVHVTGDQVLSGNVISILVSDTEETSPLLIRVEFENTGNVVARPLFHMNVFNENDPTKIVDTIMSTQNTIEVGSREIFDIPWDTKGQSIGDYFALLDVSLGGPTIKSEKLIFKILPLGTLGRSGQISKIYIEGDKIVNSPVKINADFINTGRMNTMAKFSGEIYKSNTLIDTIQSEEIMVPIGARKTYSGYFVPESSGNYVIKGKVVYSGKETEILEHSFDVKSDKSIPGFEGIYVTITLLTLFALYRKKNRGSRIF